MKNLTLAFVLTGHKHKILLLTCILTGFMISSLLACTKMASVNDLAGEQNSAHATALENRQIIGLALERELRGHPIYSPKSAIFSPDGQKFYVNALEGCETLVYDAKTLALRKTVRHKFDEKNAGLFLNGETSVFDYAYNSDTATRNCFAGKPVEAAFSHNGRYLWVTYYRRSWDKNASSPSAVAIIDTRTDVIVRVMPTGPLPKMIVPSPDGKKMAIIHWGDNTVGIVDISPEDPADFRWQNLLVSGEKLKLAGISSNRDSQCGQCLRGASFTSDSRYLFVARMGGGGLTAFDLNDGPEYGRNLGTLASIAPTPRHLVMGPDGKKLYATSNISGMVTELEVDKLLAALQQANGGITHAYRGREIWVGKGARTLAASSDGKYLFVACNNNSSLVVVDVPEWKVICSAKVPPYAVGLAVSPDGNRIVTTSQGRGGVGGHVLTVFQVLTR